MRRRGGRGKVGTAGRGGAGRGGRGRTTHDRKRDVPRPSDGGDGGDGPQASGGLRGVSYADSRRLIGHYGGLSLLAQDFYAFSALEHGWVTSVTRDAAMRSLGSRRITEAIDTGALAVQSQPDDRRRPIFTAFDRVVGGRWTFDRLREAAQLAACDPSLSAEQRELARRDGAMRRAAAVVAYSERAYTEVLHPLRRMLYEATTTGVFRMVAAECKEDVAVLYPCAAARRGASGGGGDGGGGNQRNDPATEGENSGLTELERRWRLPRDFFVGADRSQSGFGGRRTPSDDSRVRSALGAGAATDDQRHPAHAYHFAWPDDHKVWRKITPEAAAADYLAHFCADPANEIPPSPSPSSLPQSHAVAPDSEPGAGLGPETKSAKSCGAAAVAPATAATRRYPKQFRMDVTPIPDRDSSTIPSRSLRRAADFVAARDASASSSSSSSSLSPEPATLTAATDAKAATSLSSQQARPSPSPPPRSSPLPQPSDRCDASREQRDEPLTSPPSPPTPTPIPSRDLDADERRTVTDFPLVTTCRDLPVVACMTMPSVNSFLDPSVAVFEPLVIPDPDFILDYDRARRLRRAARATTTRGGAEKKRRGDVGGGGHKTESGGGGGGSGSGGGGSDDGGNADADDDATDSENDDDAGAEDRLRCQLDKRRCVRQLLPLSKIVIEIPIAVCARLGLVHRMWRDADAAQVEADAAAAATAQEEVDAAKVRATNRTGARATAKSASVQPTPQPGTVKPSSRRQPLLWCMYCPAIDMLQFGRIDDSARPLGDDNLGGAQMSLLTESAQTRFAVDVPQWLAPLPRELPTSVSGRSAVDKFLHALLTIGGDASSRR